MEENEEIYEPKRENHGDSPGFAVSQKMPDLR